MVCSLCKQLHGREHKPGCPSIVDRETNAEQDAYRAGYLAGAEQAADIAQLCRQRVAKVLSAFDDCAKETGAPAEMLSAPLREMAKAEGLL
jgi:hypothetical protein